MTARPTEHPRGQGVARQGLREVGTRERGWAPDRLERWWVDSLAEQVLAR